MTDGEKSEQIVYISCFEEVRNSFISHLSEALRLKRIINVVVDSEDQLSMEVQAVVLRARVSVMILPANPTATTCVGKLAKVLKCKRNEDQVVVPVLYGSGRFQAEWLIGLANMSGLSPVHQSRKECNDSELVNEIASDVYEKLFYMDRIGIYSKLLEIEKMVSKKPVDIRCVGIWGMPGIGKTTLAKAVFDQLTGEFDAHCFIQDYEKLIHGKSLYRLLEEQLLKEKPGATGNTTTKLPSVRYKLKNKRVLVVLDNVCNPLVAESFLGWFNWFCPGSLVIITSRDKQVFRLCRVNQIYEVKGLEEKEALRLFSLCASLEYMAGRNLKRLLTEVIKYANGNPLALNIFGRELKGKKSISEMETAFLKLKQSPPFEIFDVFKSSYDTLSDGEKNIFLDIACFFQGENVDNVKQVLEGCGFYPHVGIDVLVEKCLVTISKNCIRMHNLIQDFGRKIINRETVQMRLWEPWSIKYLLEDNEHKADIEPKRIKHAQVPEEIQGLFLDASNFTFDFKPTAFGNMLNLRLLKIYYSNPETHHVINFPDGFIFSFPNELRLLHWEKYPLQSLPQNFDPRHLVEINMPYSQLQNLWGATKNLEMLKTIRLCHSHQLVDIEDILKAQNLEVIDVQGCIRLPSFPAITQLLHLRYVNLSDCTEIKIFPEVPPNIEILHLQGTGIIELPTSIGKTNGEELVTVLSEKGLSDALKVERLTSLLKSSSYCQDLGKLICLDLKDCHHLQGLPNMVNLEFLKVLDLSGCSKLESIQGFPRNLKEVYLIDTAVREVPQLPQSLELFNAHGCVSLKSIHLDSEQLPMHYTFSYCFDLSPQVVNAFLVKMLGNVKHIPREHLQELDKALAFRFCAPSSHANHDSTLNMQPGSSIMTWLTPSWRSTLVGFTMLVEVAFPEDYCDATGFDISYVCRWKNREGHSRRIERVLHCWGPGKAVPKVQKEHTFVFCDVEMRPTTDEGNDPDIWADLLVFEFFIVDSHKIRLDDNYIVKRCGVYPISTTPGNASLENISPTTSLISMESWCEEVESVWTDGYCHLEKVDKFLFLRIVGLFNDEYVDMVAPQISSIDWDISSGLKVLHSKSLIAVSSNREIMIHHYLRKMGKWMLMDYINMSKLAPRVSEKVGSSKDTTRFGSSKSTTNVFEKPLTATPTVRGWKYDVFLSFGEQDVKINFFVSDLVAAFKRSGITAFKDREIENGQPGIPYLVESIKESKTSIVVFSVNYASSSVLLNELVEIMKSSQDSSRKVIPIFFEVDSSNVRNLTGEFGKLFKLTCESKTEDEIQQWCKALADITHLSGFDSMHYGRSCEEFIKAVVEEVKKTVANIRSQEKLQSTGEGLFGKKLGKRHRI